MDRAEKPPNMLEETQHSLAGFAGMNLLILERGVQLFSVVLLSL